MTATTVKEEIYLDQAKSCPFLLQRMQRKEIKKAEHPSSKRCYSPKRAVKFINSSKIWRRRREMVNSFGYCSRVGQRRCSIRPLIRLSLLVCLRYSNQRYRRTAGLFLSFICSAASFWGNASNPLVESLKGDKQSQGYLLNGTKAFGSGSPDSQYLWLSFNDRETGQYLNGVVPTARTGITVKDDWNAMGQRQTGSGNVDFKMYE